MSAYLRKWLFCDVCNKKTNHIIEDDLKICEECNTTLEK